MAADEAKQIAANAYRSERITKIWDKVKATTDPKKKTALMNLIRATHGAK
jgi:hypothetical protein